MPHDDRHERTATAAQAADDGARWRTAGGISGGRSTACGLGMAGRAAAAGEGLLLGRTFI